MEQKKAIARSYKNELWFICPTCGANVAWVFKNDPEDPRCSAPYIIQDECYKCGQLITEGFDFDEE